MNIFKNITNNLKAATPKEKKVVKGENLPIISRILKNFAMDKDKGVIGGYNNSFPLSTATQGNVYFLPATGKYYYCQTPYNGTQLSAPNDNFVEISVLANHDRLNNLINSSVLEFGETEGIKSIVFPNGFTNKNCHVVPIPLGITSSDLYGIKLSPDQTTITALNIKGIFAKTSVKIYFIKLL